MAGDCTTCGKAEQRIQRMRDLEDWECSHVDCSQRRVCWSAGVRAPKRELQLPPRDGIEKLFDAAEA